MKNVLFYGCIVVLLLGGFALLNYPKLEAFFYTKKQEEAVTEFKSKIETTKFKPKTETSPSNVSTLPKKSGGLVGVMSISSIDLEVGVLEGTSDEVLKKGLGIVEPKKQWETQNVAIAGHRAYSYGKQFNRMGEVQKGDVIEIQTMEATYHYEIKETFIVHKSQIEVLEDEGMAALTLITCHPLGKKNPPNRLIIKANLTRVEKR